MFGAPNQENQPIAIGRLIPIKSAMLPCLRLCSIFAWPGLVAFRNFPTAWVQKNVGDMQQIARFFFMISTSESIPSQPFGASWHGE